jgi:altronate hydrolase
MAQLVRLVEPPGKGWTAEVLPLDAVAVRLHPDDDVAIAKVPLPPGMRVAGPEGKFEVHRLVGIGHKVALRHVKADAPVRRYGQVIGFATTDIVPGDHVHTHNLAVRMFQREYEFGVDVRPVAFVPEAERRTFWGFRRPNGKVGTRNYIVLLSSVNCSATTIRAVAERFKGDGALREYPNVDGVVALTHKAGCGSRHGSPEIALLQRTIAGFARHANTGAAVLVGLGCEVNQVAEIVNNQGLAEPGQEPPPVFTIQEEGGFLATVEAGVRLITSLLPRVNDVRRVEVPAAELIVALQCGGSDGWSGVTANPALGAAADLVVQQGGTVVLAETTEVYGAEHLLIRRARSREVGEKLLERIRWWEQYTAMHGFEIDNNPSPGNKAGGLTTIYEKSLGAIAKSGTTPLNAVYEYAEPITERGFVHMDTPGYDPVSVTGQVAGGCNVIVFTTGRGSVFGFKPVPSIKVATNPDLYRRLEPDMDINAGRILEGATIEEVGREIFEYILEVASGKRSKSEAQGIGEEEFNPWILGATL